VSSTLTRTSMVLAGLNLLVKPIGIAKEIFIASLFGTTGVMDAYFVALGIPNLLAGLLGSPVSSTFTPLFVRESEAGNGRVFYRQVMGWLLSIALIVAVLLLTSRYGLARFAGPGLGPEGWALAGLILAILTPYFVLQVVGEFHKAALTAIKKFVAASIWQVLTPAITISALLLFGATVPVLAGSMVAGAAGFALVTAAILARQGLLGISRPRVTPAIRDMSRQLPFLLLSGVLLQVNLFIDRMMASTLDDGSVAALNYAFRLLMLLQMVFVAPISQVLLPYFSENVARGEWAQLVKRSNRAVRSALIMMTPVALFGIAFGQDAVAFFYERGSFTSESTRATASAFAAYVPTFLILASTLALPRYFNASAKNQYILGQTIFSVVSNVLLNLLFMRYWGHAGIALSTSVTLLVSRLGLYWLMARDVSQYGGLQSYRHLATLAGAAVALMILYRLRPLLPTPGGHLFLRVALELLVTLVVYAVVVLPYRWRDVRELIASVRGRA